MKKFLITLSLVCCILTLHAQKSVDEKAADFLRRSDNLYVVISILVTIFAGIIVFLIFQERKISKLEKQLKERNK
jgi:hypothetical protein